VGIVGAVSVKSKLKRAGRMPEVPKSVMIAKCTRCLEYRRLKDISAGVCVEPCEEKELWPPPGIEPPEPPLPGATIMEPCANCGEWTDRKELDQSEQYWCIECETAKSPD